MTCTNSVNRDCALRFAIERVVGVSLLFSVAEIATPFWIPPCSLGFPFVAWICAKGWLTLLFALVCYVLHRRRLVSLQRLSDLWIGFGAVILLWWLIGVPKVSVALDTCVVPIRRFIAWEMIYTPLVIMFSGLHWALLCDSAGNLLLYPGVVEV